MIEAGKVSVVLVDDSVDVRTLVRMRLESSGLFDVKGEAADGEQAIALVIRDEPTLVLLDVSMPRMDGLETLPSILAVRPETAVVMFSGFGGTHLAAEVRELGAIDFIEKSIPLEQLPERLLLSLQVTSPEPVTPPPPPSTSPTDAPAELLGADADATRLEQEILDEHLEGFRALFDRAAIGMATMTVHATIVRANDALADLMSCEPSELVGRRLRPPDRWAGRRPGPPPRGTADLGGERRHVRAPHPRTAGSDGRPHRPRDARPDPGLGRPDALRVRAGAGHQRPAHRRGRAAPHRGEVPVPGRRGRGVRRVHARHPRTGDELERRSAADQGLPRPRDHRERLPGLLPRGAAADGAPAAQPRGSAARRVVRRGGLARAPGRHPVLGQRRHQPGPRRPGPAHRVREGHPRPDRATAVRRRPGGGHGRAGAPARRHGPRAAEPHGRHRRQRPRPPGVGGPDVARRARPALPRHPEQRGATAPARRRPDRCLPAAGLGHGVPQAERVAPAAGPGRRSPPGGRQSHRPRRCRRA